MLHAFTSFCEHSMKLTEYNELYTFYTCKNWIRLSRCYVRKTESNRRLSRRDWSEFLLAILLNLVEIVKSNNSCQGRSDYFSYMLLLIRKCSIDEREKEKEREREEGVKRSLFGSLSLYNASVAREWNKFTWKPQILMCNSSIDWWSLILH